jgi:hypothetical protein
MRRGQVQVASATAAALWTVGALAGCGVAVRAAVSWGHAIAVPGLAALNAGGVAGVSAVSCTSAGNCAAGGDFKNHGYQAWVASERNGRWSRAIEVPGLAALNTGRDAGVDEISCAAPGNCAAGGSYTDHNPNGQGFVVSERNGRWGRAIKVRGHAPRRHSGIHRPRKGQYLGAGNQGGRPGR